MNFLNQPLLELLGYKIYPAFFIILIAVIAIVTVTFILLKSRKNVTPKEAKVRGNQRISNKDIRAENLDGNPDNEYNVISVWQKENLSEMIQRTKSEYQAEDGVESDEYTETLDALLAYLQNSKYWSVADLVKISPTAVLFLTMLTAAEVDKAVNESNIDRTVLFANAIDRMNGTFEKGASLDREWISKASDVVSSNYRGSEDGKRLLGCIMGALDTLSGVMEDGIIPEGIPYTDNNIQMISMSDLKIAAGELKEANNFILEITRNSQFVVLYALVFKLRNQIDNLISSGISQTIRPVDFDVIRGICIMADRQDYGEIVSEFLE